MRVLVITTALALVACSDGGARLEDAAVAEPIEAGTDADWLCPGHRDPVPCLPGGVFCGPGITIRTVDRSASITAVTALTTGCGFGEAMSSTGKRLEAEAAAVVAVPVAADCSVTTACTFAVSFVNGASTVIDARVSSAGVGRVRYCLDNADCCRRDQYVDTEVVGPCNLYPATFELEVPAAPDGGVAVVDAPVSDGDAGHDGDAAPAPDGEAAPDAEEWLCPGHLEPCLANNCNPSIHIRTPDWAAVITSIRVLAGGCAIDQLATDSGGSLRLLDGGFAAERAIRVFVDSPCVPAAECAFEVGFANGASTVVVTTYAQGAWSKVAHCRDNANCCPRSLYSESVGAPCQFSPWDLQLEVPSLPDGGTPPIDSGRG